MKQVHEILSNVSDRKTDYGMALYEEFCSKYPTIEIPHEVDCRYNSQNTGAFLEFIMDSLEPHECFDDKLLSSANHHS